MTPKCNIYKILQANHAKQNADIITWTENYPFARKCFFGPLIKSPFQIIWANHILPWFHPLVELWKQASKRTASSLKPWSPRPLEQLDSANKIVGMTNLQTWLWTTNNSGIPKSKVSKQSRRVWKIMCFDVLLPFLLHIYTYLPCLLLRLP